MRQSAQVVLVAALAASVPIIALTGVADAADRARIVGGFTQVLEKPCDPNSLISVLRRVLGAGMVGS